MVLRDLHLDEQRNDVQEITRIEMDTLERPKTKNCKYITDAVIVLIESGYRNNSAFWWSPRTGKTLKVNIVLSFEHGKYTMICLIGNQQFSTLSEREHEIQ